MGQPRGVHEPTQVRGAGGTAGDGVCTERSGGQGQRTTLAAAVDADARGVDFWARQEKVDGAGRVDIEAAVGVGVAIDDVVDQQSGIAGVVLAIGAELAARGDTDRGITLSGP